MTVIYTGLATLFIIEMSVVIGVVLSNIIERKENIGGNRK